MMCLVLSVMAFAQTGVDFQHLTFDEALAKAKAEKKLVFVDCYTTWCGPCKMMTTKIFPMKEAGEFFNPRFVCVKFDMEQGEGKELKNKLGVRAYPSFFIIRPDGTVQHAVVGGGELEPFIERVKKGFGSGLKIALLVAIPFFIAFFIFPKYMMMIFVTRNNTDVITSGVQFLKIVSPFYFLATVKIIVDGILRGSGAMLSFMVSTFTDLILRVIFAFILTPHIGQLGIWWSWPIGWIVASLASLALYLSGVWKKAKV